ncbi:MAG: ADP-ribosylglycohydrolase family protein, partial [Clostridia bacterium]|nr:ADP-ribosylglycohydrolase family protein [Clostridia bacterium]
GSYGSAFKAWLFSENPKPYGSCGNGAGMRISPVGFFAKTEDELKLYCRMITATTHNHKEGVKGAEAVATAIFMAKNGATKEQIKERMAKDYYPEIATEKCTYNYMHENYDWNYNGNGGLAQNSTPQAIACFLISENFEDAVRTAVSIGGDSDTIAAMTGGIAEAFYKIPEDIKELAFEYIPHEFKTVITDFERLINEK